MVYSKINRGVILIAISSVWASCKGKDEYDSFLGKKSEIFDVDKAEDKKETKSPDDEKEKKYRMVTVSEEEIDKYIKEIAALKSKVEMIEISNEAKNKEFYAEGLNACKNEVSKEKDDVKDKILKESTNVIDFLKNKISLYKATNVVVNGECIGTTVNNERYLFTLTDACLNIVTKKVGNEGNIVGIVGGLSKESLKEGIVSLECESGRSHMKFLNNGCLNRESFVETKIQKNKGE